MLLELDAPTFRGQNLINALYMIETPKIDLFIGRITKVIDREEYQVEVEIPGYGKELPAVPLSRVEMDEPVEGNLVIIMSLDPYHHDVNFYTKLKENKFVGIRSNGKVIDMTKDYIISTLTPNKHIYYYVTIFQLQIRRYF